MNRDIKLYCIGTYWKTSYVDLTKTILTLAEFSLLTKPEKLSQKKWVWNILLMASINLYEAGKGSHTSIAYLPHHSKSYFKHNGHFFCTDIHMIDIECVVTLSLGSYLKHQQQQKNMTSMCNCFSTYTRCFKSISTPLDCVNHTFITEHREEKIYFPNKPVLYFCLLHKNILIYIPEVHDA